MCTPSLLGYIWSSKFFSKMASLGRVLDHPDFLGFYWLWCHLPCHMTGLLAPYWLGAAWCLPWLGLFTCGGQGREFITGLGQTHSIVVALCCLGVKLFVGLLSCFKVLGNVCHILVSLGCLLDVLRHCWVILGPPGVSGCPCGQ